ncbi:MAG TPA: hypothetical protein DCP69_02910 [Candidatus Omnitrophica bacterium]|nr:hypothetical protein [Candidatus Omnitrophota bacterium]
MSKRLTAKRLSQIHARAQAPFGVARYLVWELEGHIDVLEAEIAALKVEVAKPLMMRVANREKRADLVISE